MQDDSDPQSRPAPDPDARPQATQMLTRELGKRELESIVMVSTLLNSAELRTERVLEVSMQAITQALDAEAGSIFLLDERTDELEIFVPTGVKGDALRGMRIPRTQGLVGWVVTNGEALLIEDAASDARFTAKIDDEIGFETRSVLCVPLKVRGRVIGALEVLNKLSGDESFHRSEVPFLQALANQVALALENARLFSALSVAYSESERMQELKGGFISIAAHELLTPLTIISANADILAAHAGEPEAEPEMAAAVSGVRNGVARLSRLSQDLSNMAWIDEGEVELDIGPVNVAELIDAVVNELAPIVVQRGLNLATESVPGRWGLEVAADRVRLRHVFRNLMLNAVRFTPDGGHIAVRTIAEADSVRVAVSDTGIGIAEADLERIFDPLVVLGTAAHHKSGRFEFRSGGMGLGLAIARGIVDAHGGKMSVVSQPGDGSTFAARIPRHPPART